jgi:hopene-associated glycosyltransferase HpnB
MILEALAALATAIWLYLVVARGGFWLCSERDGAAPAPLTAWPSVAAVIPARNEAEGIGDTIRSLLRQNYAGPFTIILVDDDSSDGTADVARAAAAQLNAADRLRIIAGQPLPRGWTGKLWAVKQGVETAQSGAHPPDYILLSDADIVYEPEVLADLAARAATNRLVLTSLMVKLRCQSFAERSLIPAFIFFFQMLYPFPWVNRPSGATAAAAGGCMLVRSDALTTAGGIDAIRNALIDDCSLAKRLKAHGPIWLGLTERVHSTRPYPDFEEIRRMVSRSAYAQLRYSPILLAGTVVGMALTYLAPPLLALFADGIARWLGLLAWGLMALAFLPTLRLYRRSPLWGVALPAIALCYMLFTLDSALQYARGKGGLWKGRVQALEP